LLSLSNSVIESIFILEQLQIENEDFLLNLILQMIESESNRKCFLQINFLKILLIKINKNQN
jgi:hypothetical protein